MNILIIPEDFRNDQYVLKPLFTRLIENVQQTFRACSSLPGPIAWRSRGSTETERIAEIVEQIS